MTDLSRLSLAEIDALPFGFIGLSREGTIRKYNRYEADLARMNPERVLGKNFFREVAPCTQVKEFEGRFRDFASGEIADPALSFEFVFSFRHGAQRVRIGLVKSPLPDEIIVTVNRVLNVDLPLSAEIRHDPARQLLLDSSDQRVVALGGDFWRALDRGLGGMPSQARADTLRLAGFDWGINHALRVEALVQKTHKLALRETELYVALEYLSGSIGVLGMGRFELDLSHRKRGLMVVHHFDSPLVTASEGNGSCCALLEGLHAGLLSHLAGRSLTAREVTCSRNPKEPCRFIAGTPSRLEKLFHPTPGSSDADLLASFGVTPPVQG